MWVKGCEGVCRISHDGPITTSTAAPTAITTPIDSGRACILDTRLGCAVFAPLHFVIEAQRKDGKWVRVAEGKWPTEECIVDINWSDFEGHCTDIRTYYEVGRGIRECAACVITSKVIIVLAVLKVRSTAGYGFL